MFELIARWGMLGAALLMAADPLLPVRRDVTHVARHSIVEHTPTNADGSPDTRRRSRTIEYRLDFTWPHASCKVDEWAYRAAQDGDEVQLDTARLTRSCERLVRNGNELIPATRRWFQLVLAAVLLAGALGWIPWPRGGPEPGFLRRARWWLE